MSTFDITFVHFYVGVGDEDVDNNNDGITFARLRNPNLLHKLTNLFVLLSQTSLGLTCLS